MDRNALAPMEQLHCPGGDAGLHLLAQQPVRHRVIVAIDIDVVIEPNTADAPFGINERLGWQCRQGGPVQFHEQLVRLTPSRRIGRVFRSANRPEMAAFSAASEANRWCRRRARIQRSTTSTPASTLALSVAGVPVPAGWPCRSGPPSRCRSG